MPPDPRRSPTGTAASRRVLATPHWDEGIALWGSSSMAGGLGDQGTPIPEYIHDLLALALSPRPVHRHGYGRHTSHHTMIVRGAVQPEIALPAGYDGGRVRVEVDTTARPVLEFAVPGTVGGRRGTLTSDGSSWFFEADSSAARGTGTADGAAARGGGAGDRFVSAYAAQCERSRHVVWTGKNNITEVDTVCAHVDAIRAMGRTPDDTIVLGQWATQHDPKGSDTLAALTEVNDRQRARYGDRFLDVQRLLTTAEGLASAPVAELGLLDRSATKADLARGTVPAAICGDDGKHLNGWGNLIVGAALLARMRRIGWL